VRVGRFAFVFASHFACQIISHFARAKNTNNNTASNKRKKSKTKESQFGNAK